jgi:CDP-diacylglycerol--serine O-phosphatidyltransferase
MAAYFVLTAAILDFLDGFVARALNAQSELGKQLDSLADVVSFGVAPGMILYNFAGSCSTVDGFCITPYFALLIPIFSAVRLAKFNIDTRQSDSFIGLPTPACAMLVISIPFTHDTFVLIQPIMQSQYFIRAFSMIMAYLLVSEISMISLKFKNLGIANNLSRYLLIAISAISIIWLGIPGLTLAILFYILLSIITHLTQKSTI